MIECLKRLKPIKAIMGIYKELGDCKLYDYSLQDALTDCLSDDIVYVYLRLLANNQNKVSSGFYELKKIIYEIAKYKFNQVFKLFNFSSYCI